MTDGLRGQRLAGTIRKLLSETLARSIEDPRLLAIGVEQVALSRDLGVATIGVRLMYGENDAKAQKAALAALNHAGPRLRATLAASLRMRRMPEFRFHYDQGEDHRRNVEKLLAEIAVEPKLEELPEGGDGQGK
jgi:ribosome-binding factor A